MSDRIDCLLVNPPWPVLDDRAMLQNTLPPLGILSIAAYLEQVGYKVAVIDIHASKIGEDEFQAKLRDLRPRFVGMTVLTNMSIPAHKIARICKQDVPDCVVIAGGVHAESMPERMLKNSSFDAIARGDGEELMREVIDGKEFADIAGLSWRDGTVVRHNPPRDVEMDLDRYPFPAYHLVNFDHYFPAMGSYRNLPAINMLMTRGCPGRCHFCNSARTVLRNRSPEKVVAQIKLLHQHYGIRQIQFYDDTFTVNKKQVMEFCQLLAAENLGVTWTAYVRGDCFSAEMAAAMKKAGCHQVLIGIETGSATLAATIGKPIDSARYHDTIRLAHQAGLEVRGSFIIGNMGETGQTMEETLDFAIGLDINLFQLSILTPYPGTQLYNDVAEKGWLDDSDWYSYGQGKVLINQPQITAKEIYDFERHAFRKFYIRPKAVMRMLARVANPRQIRDYIIAASLLLLGKKQKAVADQWACWRNLKEEDYFDTLLDLPEPLRLTHVVRQDREFA